MISKILKAGSFAYPLNSINFCILRIRFFKHILFNFRLIKTFINEVERLGYVALFQHKIPVIGAVEWPYIHKDWDVKRRFDMILGHYQIIQKLPQILDVADGNPKLLVDTHQYSVGTKLVLDKAQWFVREGEIVLSLFKDDLRMMSIAFSFSDLCGERVIYIGAIQGIHADENSLENIKILTKDFEGLRPRDLLMEVLRMLSKMVAATKILGIADEYRHHLHPYFGSYHETTLKSSYDYIWEEQQAEPFDNGLYSIPIHKERRALAEVSTNKRAMYKRRYEMLDAINADITRLFDVEHVPQPNPVTITERSCSD